MVDVPANNRRRIHSRWAGNPGGTSRSRFAGSAAFARRSKQLPSGTGTCARLIAQGQERPAVEGDRVIGCVLYLFLKRATVADRLGVTTRCCETLPIRFVIRRLARVAKRLIAAAIAGAPPPEKISGASPSDLFVLRNNFVGPLSIAAA